MDSLSLDKFYTKSEVAKLCISLVPGIEGYKRIIEPSAGSGSFSSLLPKYREAYDLYPEGPDIKEQDFLKLEVKSEGEPVLIIGNPPFGKRNRLTKDFIRHSISLPDCDMIAFILPATWNKYTLQKTFPTTWRLVVNEVLPRDSFTLDEEDYHVPCVFQVWTTKEMGEDLRDVKKEEHSRFTISTKFKESSSFFILGAAPHRAINPEEVGPTQRGYFITLKDKEDEGLKEEFSKVDWKSLANSGANGGVAWFTSSEIYKAIKEVII